MIIATAISIAISTAVIVGTYRILTQKASASFGVEKAQISEEIAVVTKELDDLLKYKDSFCAKGQYETVSKQLASLKSDLEQERSGLKQIEGRLDESQTNVEDKEANQQELKSSKEEDEIKLEELLANYADISNESIALEQKLAESMKNLDSIMAEVTASEEQKAAMDSLSQALSSAGENLRNLLTEYQSVNERLTMLTEQHEDLEDEYTKLVEQQLGE